MNQRARFDDPRRAERNLVTFNEIMLRSAPDIVRTGVEQELMALLAKCADPDMALTNFLRFLESSFTPVSLIHDFSKYGVLRELLITIFSTSQYFSDILVRDPELFRWLTVGDTLESEKNGVRYREEAAHAVSVFEKAERKINALKRLLRREILRIGVRDILGYADVVTATRELSALADAVIGCTAELAFAELAGRSGGSPSTRWTVLALGKLGGSELNYSSDIDLIVIYGDEGEFEGDGGRSIQHHEFFVRMTEMLVQWMTVPTAEGTLYRVDLRLRPDGNAGPLARSVGSMLVYYESRGEQWERQMLIKARPVAGDAALGMQFLERLAPFIYPRTFYKNPAEDIARLKNRIEEEHADDANIKLGSGGIRDIEFAVQALQLLNAGKNPLLRKRSTMEALNALKEAGLLSESEWTTLTDSYLLFRNIEHRLQMMHAVQTHTLPSGEREMKTLAMRLGMAPGSDLAKIIREARSGVRTIFESVVGGGASSHETGGGSAVEIDGVMLPTVFDRPEEARKNLHVLLRGSSTGERNEFDARTREEFRRVAPGVMECVKSSVNPDLALSNLARLAGRTKFPEQLYAMLGKKAFCALIVRVCSMSSRVVALLARHSIFIDILMARMPEVLSGGEVGGLESLSIYEYKFFQEVRAAIRDLLGVITLDDLTGELTVTAETIVRNLYSEIVAGSGIAHPRLAVIALGKFGGREITFDSDLDLVFVSSGETMERLEEMRVICQTLVSRLTTVTDSGRLYDVDARLRPEGRNAPLVTPLEAYTKYLEQRAALWEIQSLVKAREIAGDPGVMEEAHAMIDEFLSSRRYRAEDFRSIVQMRIKTESRSRIRTGDFIDIKLGSGGMLDIEFLAQSFCLLQLSEGKKVAGRSTLASLLGAAGEGILEPEEAQFLITTYRVFRTVEKYMRISLDSGSSVLPESGEKADFLAKCIGMKDFSALTSELGWRMKDVRKKFVAAMENLGRRAGK